MKRVLVFAIIIMASITSQAATITATPGGGDWSNGSSWVGGVVPVSGVDDVIIPSGSTITVTGTVNFNGVIDVFGNFDIGPGDLIMDGTSYIISNSPYVVDITDFGSSLTIGTETHTAFSLFLSELVAVVVEGETYPLSVTEGGVVTPITLLFFEAKSTLQRVELTWATATEENFDYFALERSENGEDFIEIAQIQGMGDSFKRVDYSKTVAQLTKDPIFCFVTLFYLVLIFSTQF